MTGRASRFKRDVRSETSVFNRDVRSVCHAQTVTFEPEPFISFWTPRHPTISRTRQGYSVGESDKSVAR